MSLEGLDIFNLSVDDLSTEEVKSFKSDFYKPMPTDPKATDGVYTSVIRFMPNITTPKKTIISKYQYWLTEADNNGFYVDSPSTIGEKHLLDDTYWKLYRSESAFDKRMFKERFSRKEYFYVNVFVIKDPQHPELENTIQTWRFPRTVKKMIDEQLRPSQEDIEFNNAEPVQVFDFFEGKNFIVKVGIKGGYWNYDDCKFADKISPLKINGTDVTRDDASRKLIMSLYEDAPDLNLNDYQPWDDELTKRVNEFLREFVGEKSVNQSKSTVTKKQVVESKNTKTKNVTDDVLGDMPFDDEIIDTSDDGDDSIEDWLEEYGI